MKEINFVDEVVINVKAGDGGNGIISFRREKFVPLGGPDGGDGGDGGSIYLIATKDENTLVRYRFNKHFKAQRGAHGKGKNMIGRKGEDLYLPVPIGTIVYDNDTGQLLGQLLKEGDTLLVAKGGRGGRGNASFKTSTRQAPRICENGEEGEEKNLKLVLKLLSDVGLVGLYNAGKSTFLNKVSNSKPKVADYPFTTLRPYLGVVERDYKQMVIADLPGLIEGASEGKGLGIQFLKHIEKCKILLFIIPSTLEKTLLEQLKILVEEIKKYDEKILEKKKILAVNKIDLPDVVEMYEEEKDKLYDFIKEHNFEEKIFLISSVTGENLDDLINYLFKVLESIDEREELSVAKVQLKPVEVDNVEVEKIAENTFVVHSKKAERLVKRLNLSTADAVVMFQRLMNRLGIDEKLKEAGIEVGDTVVIGDFEFEWT